MWIFELIRIDFDLNGLQSAKSSHKDGNMRIECENGRTRSLKKDENVGLEIWNIVDGFTCEHAKEPAFSVC